MLTMEMADYTSNLIGMDSPIHSLDRRLYGSVTPYPRAHDRHTVAHVIIELSQDQTLDLGTIT